MSFRWPDTFVGNSRTAYMTATALLIASFIELTTQSLSLLDGLVVSLMTTMMITFAIASYSATESEEPSENRGTDNIKSPTRWFMQLCFVVFWAAWGFHMWRDPAHFGLRDEAANCDTNYKITMQLFREVYPTDPSVRNAALSLIAIGFVVAVLSLFFTLEECLVPVFWFFRLFKKKKDREETEEEINNRGMTTNRYDDPLVQTIHVFLQAIAIGTYIFLIYAIEQTINKNDFERTTRDWSYGQTIALILLLQQIMDLFSTIIEEREKKEADDERQALANGDRSGFPSIPIPLAHRPPLQSDANAGSSSDSK
ncbi:unnamed protein product [Rhizoctonia solani]|uniref:Uncharacterized protein n=1 Tax=Rhizoctonia solani TaxID=456999 RepID=A0A8H3B9Q9_9AGAM|nr:unnamed protein product [Rhizoctonia solani]